MKTEELAGITAEMVANSPPLKKQTPLDIPDSGEREVCESGAVRDVAEGKGRCDLLPFDILEHLFNEYGTDDADTDVSLVFSCLHEFLEESLKVHRNEIPCQCHPLYEAIDIFISLAYNNYYDAVLGLALRYEEGAIKYKERNWEQGLYASRYLSSAVRHLMKWLQGMDDEDHDNAVLWNLVGLIWTLKHKPEYDDLKDAYAMRDKENKTDLKEEDDKKNE